MSFEMIFRLWELRQGILRIFLFLARLVLDETWNTLPILFRKTIYMIEFCHNFVVRAPGLFPALFTLSKIFRHIRVRQ